MKYCIVTQDVRNEVRQKYGTDEAANVLLCALESRVSVTPQCLTKILSVLEGSTVTNPVASKIRKTLSKSFSARRKTSSSPNPGRLYISVAPLSYQKTIHKYFTAAINFR